MATQSKVSAEVFRLINELKVDEALAALYEAFDVNDRATSAEYTLTLAKIYILKGHFTLAAESLESFRRLDGALELFFLEKLNLHYLAGDFGRWRATLTQALHILGPASSLSFQVLDVSEQIAFVKHLEEAGFITETLEFYRQLIKSPQSDRNHLRAQAQLVRLQAVWNIKSDLANSYNELLLLKPTEFDSSFYVEAQHALLLAETALFGVEQGLSRIQKVKLDQLDIFDQKLLLFDLCELSAAQYGVLLPVDISRVPESQLDPYEAEVLALLNGKKTLSLGPSDIPANSLFRLMLLASKLGANLHCTTLESATFLLLEQFETKTKRFWKTQLQSVFDQNEKTFNVAFRNKTLIYNERSYSFENQPALGDLIALLSEKGPQTSVESLSQQLFSAPADVSLFDRLRVNLNRLNRLFESQFGIAKPFKIREGTIESTLRFRT